MITIKLSIDSNSNFSAIECNRSFGITFKQGQIYFFIIFPHLNMMSNTRFLNTKIIIFITLYSETKSFLKFVFLKNKFSKRLQKNFANSVSNPTVINVSMHTLFVKLFTRDKTVKFY